LSPASTPSQELEQRSKFLCYWTYIAFLMIILMSIKRFWDLLVCQILLLLVLPFCVLGKHTTDIPPPVDDSSALVSQRIDHKITIFMRFMKKFMIWMRRLFCSRNCDLLVPRTLCNASFDHWIQKVVFQVLLSLHSEDLDNTCVYFR